MKIIIEKDLYGWKFQFRTHLSDPFWTQLSKISHKSADEKKKIIDAFMPKHEGIKRHYFKNDELILEGHRIGKGCQITQLTDLCVSLERMLNDAIADYKDFKRKVEAVTS